LPLHKKACAAGRREGCGAAGFLLYAKKDPDALTWLRKGCASAKDHPLYCGALGGALLDAKHTVLAKTAYRYACAGAGEGAASGCAILGWLLMKEGDDAAAEVSLIACLADEASGCLNYGTLMMKKAPSAATAYLKKACQAKLAEACANLGVVLDDAGDAKGAEAALKKACDGGAVVGCANLAAILARRGDAAGARALYSKACKAGDQPSCEKVE
jgi:TPR repeat protein